jgi:Xaa-Pro aminopeptidase
MLTAEGCATRRARLWNSLTEPLDVVLLSDPKFLMYFGNFWISPFVFRANDAGGVLILTKDGGSTLVSDSMVKSYASDALVDNVVTPGWYDGQHSVAHPRRQLLVKSTLEVLESIPGKRIGYAEGSLPGGILEGLRAQRPDIEFVALDPLLRVMQRAKDPDEVALIRKSLDAMTVGFETARRDARPGMSELELFLMIQAACNRAAADQVPIYGDFVCGERTVGGGGPPGLHTIQAGDMVLLDFSVVVHGYRGDCANAFCCGASPTDEQRRLHDACVDALKAGEALLAPGVACREIDAAVKKSFDAKGLLGNWSSHTGHGLGLSHPDAPYFVGQSSDTLMVGDVVTIEPGQFVAGVGGMRVEHNYLITADGYEQLSTHELAIDQPK